MASATEVAAAPPAGVAHPAVRVLRENLGDQVLRVEEFRGDLAITVSRKAWVRAVELVRDHPELDFKLFLDLCGVDWLEKDDHDDRYEVVLHLYSVSKKHHLRLKTTLPEADAKLPTITSVYRGASWFEREAWDLYGIVFEGHPNLRRLLTHEAFAMQVMGLEEAPEAVILRRVRAATGGATKVAVSYDLHANLSAGLLDGVDIMTAYRTNPHWDLAPTGFRAGNRLIRPQHVYTGARDRRVIPRERRG